MPVLTPATLASLAIDTERLTLRIPRAEDFPDSRAMWSDPEVTRHISGRPSTEEESWSRLLRYLGHWEVLGYGCWIVREKGSGAFVGEVGLFDYHRDVQPSFGGAPEVGWVLAPSAHGKGYATETVRAVLAWGDAHLPARRTVCMISPENLASLRVAEKCGFRPYARGIYRDQEVRLFERTV